MYSELAVFQRVNMLRKHLNEINDHNKNYYYRILHNIADDLSFRNGLNAYKHQTNNCNLGDFLIERNALDAIASFPDSELIRYIESL
jgi:hypothetical protein